MVFQSAMNSLNPVMKIGDQITDVLMKHKNMSEGARRARVPLSCSRSSTSTRAGWTPTRTSYRAGCASVR